MSLTTKQVILIAIIVIVAFILGRLAVRAFMNFHLGRNLVWREYFMMEISKEKKEKKEKNCVNLGLYSDIYRCFFLLG